MGYTQSISEGHDRSSWNQALALLPRSYTVRSTEPKPAWEAPLVRSYIHTEQMVITDGMTRALSNQANSIMLSEILTDYAATLSASMPASSPTAADWLTKFETFLAGLPQVDHAVDSSRDSLY